MKHEWKKHEKELYGAKEVPGLFHMPLQKFIMTSGKGNPNHTDFSDRVSALYTLAYAIKMRSKSAEKGSQDFTVYPLEGIWKQKEDTRLINTELIKENLEYTIMIRQPDFITEDLFSSALEQLALKKPNPLYRDIRFESMQDGACIEILHVGAFDDEPASFAKMDAFALENGFKRTGHWHREIYLNNANRTEKSKLKTILRYPIQ